MGFENFEQGVSGMQFETIQSKAKLMTSGSLAIAFEKTIL
jgi:hypothetical protein